MIFFGVITFVQAENNWIKKKDKTEKVKKVEKKKASNWIKKKEVKENKKKLKEKIKESKSWISKKSKDKVKDIKEKLKAHKSVNQLPKAEFYFAAIIEPNENEEAKYFYGYVNSDKTSKKFDFKGQKYFSKSDGIAYFDNKENRCEVDSQIGSIGSTMMGEVVLQCKKGLKMTGGFRQLDSIGRGDGVTSDGNFVTFEFFTSKSQAVAKLQNYQINSATRTVLAKKNQETNENLDLKVAGKYYALLIGNSDYEAKGKYNDLISPKNDVTKLAKVLESKYDFEVITGIDVTRDEFFDKIDELKNVVTDNDYVLIYYSGHGEKVENERYWIPVNGSKNNRRNWFNVDDLTSSFVGINPEIPSTHLALLVDSCWFTVKGSDTIKNKKSSFSKLLKSRAAIVMASGNDEYVDEPGKGNSDFAKIIISELENTNSPIRLHNIYMKVSEETGGLDQNPFYRPMNIWNHKNGDFIFIPKS